VFLPRAVPEFVAGLDLAQAHDYTALAIAEVRRPVVGPPHLDVRHLERLRGVRYPEVVRLVKERLVALTTPFPRPTVRLAVDRTGVGRPVGDAFVEAGLPCDLTQITITGGDSVVKDDAGYKVPKRDLVAAVQIALQTSRLKVAQVLPEAATFVREATAFRVTISDRGHDSYAAWREGDHDDLVLAVAMACWLATDVQREATRQSCYLDGGGGFRSDNDDDDDDAWPGPSWRM